MSEKKESSSNLSDALLEAQNIVSAARQRAEQLVSEAESLRDDAEKQGYEEGYKKAQEDIANTAIRLIEESQGVGERLSEEAACLALAICASIIGEHVKVAPETAKLLAVKALQEAVIGETATITAHPDDKEILTQAIPELRRLAGGALLVVVSDEAIKRGGCIVATDFGEVDASIDSMLEVIADRMGVPRNAR